MTPVSYHEYAFVNFGTHQGSSFILVLLSNSVNIFTLLILSVRNQPPCLQLNSLHHKVENLKFADHFSLTVPCILHTCAQDGREKRERKDDHILVQWVTVVFSGNFWEDASSLSCEVTILSPIFVKGQSRTKDDQPMPGWLGAPIQDYWPHHHQWLKP